MSVTLPIIERNFTSGVTVYAVRHNKLNGQVWNGSAFEVYNAAHWTTYAIALAEQAGSGYYAATAPAGTAGFLVSDAFYQQAGGTPATSDGPPFALVDSGGVNVSAISGDAATAPTNLQSVLSSQTQGVVAGVPTTSTIPTNLANATAGAYSGRVLYMTSGAAAGMAALISNYTVASGVLTLSGGLAVAPSAGDDFVIA